MEEFHQRPCLFYFPSTALVCSLCSPGFDLHLGLRGQKQMKEPVAGLASRVDPVSAFSLAGVRPLIGHVFSDILGFCCLVRMEVTDVAQP